MKNKWRINDKNFLIPIEEKSSVVKTIIFFLDNILALQTIRIGNISGFHPMKRFPSQAREYLQYLV